jgi:hypothetical protein
MSNLPFKLNARGYVDNRESSNLEFKANFHYGDSLVEYCRSMVGMANNKGGRIIFGVEDNPRKPTGMGNKKFIECDPSKINSCLLDHFSQEIEWELETVEYDSCLFGIIHINEADTKPIICKKAKSEILREGAIYYRYRGETKEIQYAELAKILDKEREKEKLLWIKHIEKIAIAGPKNAHILDTFRGELHTDKGKILIDESLLDKIKFIKEGQFSETEGAPTLRLLGDIEGITDTTNVVASDAVFPLLSSQLGARLGLNSHEMTCIIWKLGIKNKPEFHSETRIGKSTLAHKYSEKLIPLIERLLRREQFLSECKEEYSKTFLQGKTRKKVKANR